MSGGRRAGLVLNRGSLEQVMRGGTFPVHPDEMEVHLVTRRWTLDSVDTSSVGHVHALDLRRTEVLTALTGWLLEEFDIRAAACCSESLITFAAQLRERYGLPGMTVSQAKPFRDKVAMKQVARRAGVHTPDFLLIRAACDFDRFDFSGGAGVLKPVDSWGGRGIHVVGSRHEADEMWRKIGATPFEYEIESFADGVMHHCDSVWTGGERVFSRTSRYLASPGTFPTSPVSGSVLLPERHPDAIRVSEADRRLTAALGLTDGVTHMECFVAPGAEVVLCETAARHGGGGIADVIHHATGVDLAAATVRTGLGLPVDTGRRAGDGWSGYLGFYPHPGRHPEISTLARVDGVVSARRMTDPGLPAPPRNCVDFTVQVLVEASTEDELYDRLRNIALLGGVENALPHAN